MTPTNDDIKHYILSLTPTIWSTTAQLEVHPSPDGHALPDTAGTLGACVHISGAWEGAVVLQCAPGLAARAARVMLHLPSENASAEDMRDALGELANITGGNLKAALPSPSHLSLPVVAQGDDLIVRVLKSRRIAQLAFESEGFPLVISVLMKEVK